MNEKQLFSLISKLWRDVNSFEFYWVALLLMLVLALSWWIAHCLNKSAQNKDLAQPNLLRSFGAGSVKRVAFPLIALGLTLILRQVLVFFEWQHLSLLYLAGSLLFAGAVVKFSVYLLRCISPQGGFLRSFERPISVLIWCSLVLEITGFATPLINVLEQVSLSVGKQKIDLWMLLHGGVTVLVTLLIALWLGSLLENQLLKSTRIDVNVRQLCVRIIKGVLSVIALLLSLSLVGIDITALSVFSGALAVGLGFGLQKIASNYVSGFIILLDRSIRLGSVMALDDKTIGTITQITTRYTVMSMLGGTEIIIPNEYLISNIVRNLSPTTLHGRASIKIQVGYSADIEQAMALMVSAAQQQTRVLSTPAPNVLLNDFADSGINLELFFWVADPEAGTGALRSEIGIAIWKAFRDAEIEIPFPQCEVRILGNAQHTPAT